MRKCEKARKNIEKKRKTYWVKNRVGRKLKKIEKREKMEMRENWGIKSLTQAEDGDEKNG